MRYMVCLDGGPPFADNVYDDAVAALGPAQVLKQNNPGAVVTIVLVEDAAAPEFFIVAPDTGHAYAIVEDELVGCPLLRVDQHGDRVQFDPRDAYAIDFDAAFSESDEDVALKKRIKAIEAILRLEAVGL